MNGYEKACRFMYLIGAALIVMLIADGCKSTEAAGDGSVVESRILAARLDERSRIAAELSKELREDLQQIDAGVDAIAGAGQRVEYAVREYRQLHLKTLDRLQQLEDSVREGVLVDVTSNKDTGGVDRD